MPLPLIRTGVASWRRDHTPEIKKPITLSFVLWALLLFVVMAAVAWPFGPVAGFFLFVGFTAGVFAAS